MGHKGAPVEKRGEWAKEGRRVEGTKFSLAHQEPRKKPSWMCRGDLIGSRRVGRGWAVVSEQPLLGATKSSCNKVLSDRDFGSTKRTRIVQYSIVTTHSVVILYIGHAWKSLIDLSPNSFFFFF